MHSSSSPASYKEERLSQAHNTLALFSGAMGIAGALLLSLGYLISPLTSLITGSIALGIALIAVGSGHIAILRAAHYSKQTAHRTWAVVGLIGGYCTLCIATVSGIILFVTLRNIL